MLTRIWSLATKELLQLWRDKLILLFVILGPVSELAMVAWATSGTLTTFLQPLSTGITRLLAGRWSKR